MKTALIVNSPTSESDKTQAGVVYLSTAIEKSGINSNILDLSGQIDYFDPPENFFSSHKSQKWLHKDLFLFLKILHTSPSRVEKRVNQSRVWTERCPDCETTGYLISCDRPELHVQSPAAIWSTSIFYFHRCLLFFQWDRKGKRAAWMPLFAWVWEHFGDFYLRIANRSAAIEPTRRGAPKANHAWDMYRN